MSTPNSYQKVHESGPSIFALLVHDINKMSEPEQKLLWIQINKEKLDEAVLPHNFLPGEIDELINEAHKHGHNG